MLAIKVYEKFKLLDLSKKKAVIKEIQALKKLQGHSNIIKLYDVIDTPKQICLVLEYAQGKVLSELLNPQLLSIGQQAMSSNQALHIFRQILLAL